MSLSLRRIRAIYRKDLRGSIRDSRVMIALVLPFAIGIFYNLTFKDRNVNQLNATVVYAAEGETTLPELIQHVSGPNIKIKFVPSTPEGVRQTITKNDADLGLILPAGFDAGVKSGNSPNLTVVQRAAPTVAGDYVASVLQPALRQLAGQAPPATLSVDTVARDPNSESVQDRIGLRTWAVLAAVVMMIAMIGMLALPVILAEENEKKTLDALVMISNYVEVIIAKALLGISFVVISVPLLLRVTSIHLESRGKFALAVGLLAIDLIGLGLLMAGLFKNANLLNTWSGIIMLPVIAPAFAVGLPIPKTLGWIFGALPSGAAAKLLFNSAATGTIFPSTAAYLAILLAWGVAIYLLLFWSLSRRQA